MTSSPGPGWFASNDKTQPPPRTQPYGADNGPAPYLLHTRPTSSSSTTESNNDSPRGPSSNYGSPAYADHPSSFNLPLYTPTPQPLPNSPFNASDRFGFPQEDDEPIMNTLLPSTNTTLVDGIPVPPHQQYYPRSAWGPPPPRKVVQARMEEQRRVQEAQLNAMRSGASSDLMANTIDPTALSGIGTKRKQPPESDDVLDGGNIELTNPTSGDLDNLVDGHNDDEKPPYPLSTILKFTLLGSPRGKLTLSEIYETVMARFPYYKMVKTDWQVSTISFCWTGSHYSSGPSF